MTELTVYHVASSSEWDSAPYYYHGNKSFYDPIVEKATKALQEAGGDYMVFYWVDEVADAIFLKPAEDNETIILTAGRYECSEFTSDDCEINWQGANLKVYNDGRIQLFWDSKHTDEKLWCDFDVVTED